jgi:hypothetical protein
MASRILGAINIADYDVSIEIKKLNSLTKLPEEYDEFGQGYWKNISLFNASGDACDSHFRNARNCLQTQHAKTSPEIVRLINENFKLENLKMVRARSLIDGMVIPHRDFVELDKSIDYFRIFVALEDNQHAFHSDELGVFQMRAGEVWFLDAGINHAAINFGTKSRMFLCLDFMLEGECNPNKFLADHVLTARYRKSFYVARQTLQDEHRTKIIHSTAGLLNRHTFKDLVFALAKLPFIYNVPVASCYEWIISAADITQDQEIINKAKSLRRYLIEHRDIGERYTINDWTA